MKAGRLQLWKRRTKATITLNLLLAERGKKTIWNVSLEIGLQFGLWKHIYCTLYRIILDNGAKTDGIQVKTVAFENDLAPFWLRVLILKLPNDSKHKSSLISSRLSRLSLPLACLAKYALLLLSSEQPGWYFFLASHYSHTSWFLNLWGYGDR